MTFLILFVIAVVNFSFGLSVGYLACNMFHKQNTELDEKEIYCHGFEDGIYYTIDEYNPELFRPEIAEMRYKEYKAIKHGPEKH
jgi:hypothetical protein